MAKYKKLFTACHRAEKGIPSWSLEWDEETEEEDAHIVGFGYCVIHIHSIFGRVRQILMETETGMFYNIPVGKFEDVMKLPTVLDMEIALADQCVNGLTIREDT